MAERMEYDSAALSRVARGALCSGCGGCALVAPAQVDMQVTAAGFLRPVQSAPLSAQAEAQIAAICPGLGQTVDAGARRDDPLWGPSLEMCEGWATDPDLRHAGSSGGGLSALLVHLLDSGTVDAVVQTGADPDLPVGNVPVVSLDADAVARAAGSRYAPSAPLAQLEPVLSGAKRYAFVGKPCDVAALRALASHDARVDARIPVLLSFFCAGVPSLNGAAALVRKMGADPPQVETFRYRGMGWPGRATAKLKDGSSVSMSYHDSWGGVLSAHVQHRCKVCADGTGVAADIVCADAWVCDDKGYPLFEEADGISLFVARSQTGAEVLAQAQKTGHVETRPFEQTRLEAMQPGQAGRRKALLARLAGCVLTGHPVPKYRGLQIGAAARRNPLAQNLRNFLGTVRRGLQGRI